MIYSESVEQIDSFEALYKRVIFKNNNLVIPYINLGVRKHPINDFDNQLKFIDYSYLVFLNVSFLSVYICNKTYTVIDAKTTTQPTFYFGGDYLDYDSFIFNDLQICCEKAYLQTLEFSKLSNEMWMPLDTKTVKMNMDKKLVREFFDHKYITAEIELLTK